MPVRSKARHVNVVVLILAAVYAGVMTFGAWTLIRRRRWLAFGHLAAAGLLIVGGVVAAYGIRVSALWLAAGSLMASLVSYGTARQMARRVVPRNHLARAALGLALVGLALILG